MPLAAADPTHTAGSWGAALGSYTRSCKSAYKQAMQLHAVGKEEKQAGFSAHWHSVASPSAGMLRGLCRLLLPPGLPSSLLWCGAGSSPLPQAAFVISPELCSKSCHFTFFFLLQAWKTTAGEFERILDQQSPVEDFAFFLQRCLSAHRGCLWQNSPCFHGDQP